MPHPRPSWPRRLRRLCVFLLLGLATTVVVAWGFAVFVSMQHSIVTELGGVYQQFSQGRENHILRGYAQVALGSQRRQWVFCDYGDEPRDHLAFRPSMKVDYRNVLILSWDTAGPLSWGQLPAARRAFMLGEVPDSGIDQAHGWPALALWYEIRGVGGTGATGTARTQARGGICLTPEVAETASLQGFRALPLLPIWPGLAFNTLFYALLWYLAFASARMVKHNRRYRRGLCPICRYDLRADYSQGCSECGWKR